MNYVISEATMKRIREVIARTPPQSVGLPRASSPRLVTFVRITGAAVAGFYPCVAGSYLTPDAAWEEYDAAVAIGANGGALASGTRYPAIRAGDKDDGTFVFVADDSTGGSSTDKLVAVSADDTTPDYLENKLVAGSNITITENSEGGNETLTIAATGGSSPSYTSTVTSGGTSTLTSSSPTTQNFTGTLNQTVAMPAVSTLTLGTPFVLANNSSGTLTAQSSGGNTIGTVPPGLTATLTSNATIGTGASVWNGSYTGDVGVSGTGSIVLTTSPTIASPTITSPILTTPALGTPSSGTLSSCTGLPIGSGVSGLGTGVGTFLGSPTSANLSAMMTDETGSGSVVFGTSPTLTSATLVTPALGTPSSGTLTSCTGLPIATGVSGLGANVATFLAAPNSANLAAALTDESGSGTVAFTTSPTFVTPTLGVATVTSINKVAIAAPATSATLAIADGKTATVSNTLAFTGTDGSSVNFGAGGTVSYGGSARTEGTLAAAGSSQGTAAAITTDAVKVTGADGTKGVILPDNAAEICVVWNDDSLNQLKVYPPSGARIGTNGTNVSINVSGQQAFTFRRVFSTQWTHTINASN